MQRPKVHSISQWGRQHIKADGCTSWSIHSIVSLNVAKEVILDMEGRSNTRPNFNTSPKHFQIRVSVKNNPINSFSSRHQVREKILFRPFRVPFPCTSTQKSLLHLFHWNRSSNAKPGWFQDHLVDHVAFSHSLG